MATSSPRNTVTYADPQDGASAAAHGAAVAEYLPQHPGYLVLPSAYLRQLNAIRLAGGSVVWLDLVTKVNKVKRQQQRLVILTQTHLYACLPDEGDIQRCLPLADITAAHVHVPASACIGGPSRRTRSVFGNLVNAEGGGNSRSSNGDGGLTSSPPSSPYGGNSSGVGFGSPSGTISSNANRTKCEVLLICPSEYDLLFFVNDNTFQHFIKALTAPQDRSFLGPSAQLAASFAGTGSNSFSGSIAATGTTKVPIFEVPQPILQSPALMAKARLEKPARYTRTKAARFVTCFTKLVAPPRPNDDEDDPYDDDAGSVGSGGSVDYASDDYGGSTAGNSRKGSRMAGATSPPPAAGGSSSPMAAGAEGGGGVPSDASALLDDKVLRQRAARQRAISFHIPLPDADDLAAQKARKEAAKNAESQQFAGRIALDSDDDGDRSSGDEHEDRVDALGNTIIGPRGGNSTGKNASAQKSSGGGKGDITFSSEDDEDNEAAARKRAKASSKQRRAGKNASADGGEDSDDLLAEMELDQQRRRSAGPASPDRQQQQGASSPSTNATTNKEATRWASPNGASSPQSASNVSVNISHDYEEDSSEATRTRASTTTRWQQPAPSSSPAQALGTRDGWLGVMKAHKAQNDALRRIIADLQMQVSSLTKENVALKASGAGSAAAAAAVGGVPPAVAADAMGGGAPTQPRQSVVNDSDI